MIITYEDIQEYENFLKSKLFPYELTAYEKGLKHYGGTLKTFLGIIPDHMLENGTIELNIQELPTLVNSLPLTKPLEDYSEEEGKEIEDFGSILFKLHVVFADFLIRQDHPDEAIWFLQMMSSNIGKLSDRLVGDIDHDEIKEYLSILNRKKEEAEAIIRQRDLQIQIKSTPNLYFQKSDAVLERLSKKLRIDGITEQPLGFYNVFKEHSKCFITESEADRFVALIYYMIEMKPPLIVTDGNKIQGVVGRAKKFFCNNSSKGVQSISFPDRMGRIRKNRPRKLKIDEFVIKFMKEFQSGMQ